MNSTGAVRTGSVRRSLLRQGNLSKLLLGVILLIMIVVPIVRMILYVDSATFRKVFHTDQFFTALWNSLSSTVAATVISITLAYALAWALTRTDVRCKYLFTILITLPMLIPSISHGMGLIILFGNNGVLTRLFGFSAIYGFWGVVFGSVLYSFPIAFIMIADVLKYEDQTPYEAADVLGIPRRRQFASITFPYIRKPMISVLFAIFTMIVTDYGVTLSIGGQFKTLPVLLYEEVGQYHYSVASVYGIVLLLPALIAFLFDLFNKDRGNSAFVTKEYQKHSRRNDAIGYAVVLFVSLLVLTVLSSFILQAFAKSYPTNMELTFAHFANTFSKNGGKYLRNSVIIAAATAVIGVAIGCSTAYLTVRMKSRFSRFLHLMAIVSLAVPGLVLGLSYVIVFKSAFLYGTIAILIMVNTVHFFASPYLMIYNAFGKMNENLEPVGEILGVSRLRIIRDVILPQSKYTLVEMFSYFFVNSMMTISAVSLLARPSNKPLSLMINQFETYNMLECAAVVALLILAVNLLMKGIIFIIKKIGANYADKKTI